MKRLGFFTKLFVSCCFLTAMAQGQLLVEYFPYTPGSLLTANGWSAHSGTGTNSTTVVSPALTYANYPGSGLGNSALVGSLGGEDVNFPFATQAGNGKVVYFSFLANVNDTASTRTGDYFIHIGNRVSPTAFTFFAARVFAKITSGQVNFGLSNTSTATYGTTNFAKNTVYLVIVKYSINTAGNDTTSLWVITSGIPASEAAAGTPELTNTATAGQDTLNAIALRQGTSGSGSQTLVDGIRLGNTWASVTTGLVDEVTFRVNMSIQMRENAFLPGSGDFVGVRGNFNGWSASKDTLRSTGPTDSTYTKTLVLDSAIVGSNSLAYKFFKTLRSGLDWEGDQPTASKNREYTLSSGMHTLPVVWFNNDSIYTAPAANVSVTFRVNMSIKIKEQTFRPDLNDIVRVAGSFNDWGNSLDTLKKGATDSIYSKAITLQEGQKLKYKFLKTSRGGIDWESGNNRTYTVPTGGGVLPAVWFDYDSVYNAPVTTQILWQTDMTAFKTLGWFDAAKDSMQVRGGFEGWGGTKMLPNFLDPNIYEAPLNYVGSSGDQLAYKFYMKLDSATALQRFPGLILSGGSDDNRNGFYYEHPAERGDGNRLYNVQLTASQTPTRNWYSDIHPEGLLGATDSVTVTLSVNMGPAKRYSNAFSPDADTVYVMWVDALWRSAQRKNQGSFPDGIKMTKTTGDSIYSVSFKVKGKTHYSMIYYYRFSKSDGTSVDEGGGLGVQNPYRSRFIRKSGSTWPTTYSAPQDTWQKDAPLPAESAQFVTDVVTATGPPETYALFQNYPNPFNPTTTIKYTLPQQATVHLKIYNLLGQEIAELVSGIQPAGVHIVAFDAHALSSGVYFYRLEAGNFVDHKKMMLLR